MAYFGHLPRSWKEDGISDLNVAAVALQADFNTPQYFNLAFRKEFGMTPRHFRLKAKGQ